MQSIMLYDTCIAHTFNYNISSIYHMVSIENAIAVANRPYIAHILSVHDQPDHCSIKMYYSLVHITVYLIFFIIIV